MKDGFLNICKICTRQKVEKYRKGNIDAIRKYDRERGGLEHRIDARAVYNRTDNYKKSHLRANQKYMAFNPKKRKAKNIVTVAKRSGKLQCSPCEICGCLIVEAHHDDYNKPLSVRWLCPEHHRDWHKKNNAIE